MIKLFEGVKTDKKLRNDLIEGNLKLVLSILKSFVNRKDNMDDLFKVDVIGLVKAVDNFGLSYENKFSIYAIPTIVGEVMIL